MSILHGKQQGIHVTNGGKASSFLLSPSFLANESQVQKEHKRISLLAEWKRMLHPRVFLVKNCMTWCLSTVTLCLVSNPVSKSFLVLV